MTNRVALTVLSAACASYRGRGSSVIDGFDVGVARLPIVLGIETSCDETAAAVVRGAPPGPGEILSNVIASQLEAHQPYGGVVPEIAARAHVDLIEGVVTRALDEAGLEIGDIDAVAATAGPGLIGGVAVGLSVAKGIAFAARKGLIAINHLEAHALTARLTDGVVFPYLLLLVSGGHCQILICDGVSKFRLLGTTIDDAAGEAFDKIAKMLGLGMPGGPVIESAAVSGNPKAYRFPRPLIDAEGFNFSFSGLKTAVRRVVEQNDLDALTIGDIAASAQSAIVESLSARTRKALQSEVVQQAGISCLVVAGGVAANKVLSHSLSEIAAACGVKLIVPPARLCTDNGAMVAWAGVEHVACGDFDDLSVAARARWPLDFARRSLPGAKA